MYLYNFSKYGTFTKVIRIENMDIVPSILIFHQCINDIYPLCFLFLGFINSNKNLEIFKIKHSVQDNTFSQNKTKEYDIKNSLFQSSKSKSNFVSCQIMKMSEDENILTCFYENNNNEIGTVNFNLIDLSEISSKPPKFRTNDGASIIKSVLYSNNSKAFVCYLNDKKDAACLSFDINENKWNNCEFQYLKNCNQPTLFFSFDYFQNLNEYILTCFSSIYTLNSISFNSNMEIIAKNNKIYCISNVEITSCEENSFAFSFNYNTGYEIDISCSYSNMDQLKTIPFSSSCTSTSEEFCFEQDYYSASISDPINQYKSDKNTYLTIDQIQSELNTIQSTEKFYNSESQNIIINKQTINITKEELVDNLDNFMKNVEIGKVYLIEANDYEVKISPINFNKYDVISSTYINFLDCEKKIRAENHLPQESIITVIQIEIYNNIDKSLTNQVEYAVYDEKTVKLDLSVCEKEKIEINYGITNASVLELDKISYFNDMNIDILNIKDKFFNDICYSYSDKGSDMILKDRISVIYQNFSMCDNNCEYNKINISSMQISCNCNIKSKIDTEIKPINFDKIYADIFAESTFNVIKCFRLVFNFNNKLKNYGFIIFTILILMHIPIIIYYIVKGILPINKYIINEMEKYNYFPKLNSPKKKKIRKVLFNINKEIKEDENDIKLAKLSYLKKNTFYTITSKNSINDLRKDTEKKSINKDRLKTSRSNNLLIFNSENYNINNNNPNNKTNKRKQKLNSQIKINVLKKVKELKYKTNKIEKQSTSLYYLIKIDATNSVNHINEQSEYFLDHFDYEDAITYDKRSFGRLYLICLYAKENILSTFFLHSPLEPKPIKLILFIFIYSSDFALNTLFYFSEKISDKYNYKGQNLFWYNLFNNLTISFLSFIISYVIIVFLQLLTNAKDSFEEAFKEEEKKMKNNKKYKVSHETKLKIIEKILKTSKIFKIRIIIFVLIEIFIMLFFYYFVTAFCEVYKETQKSWLIDSFVSFLISFPVEFLLALIICSFYVIAIKRRIKCLYKIAMVLYNLG